MRKEKKKGEKRGRQEKRKTTGKKEILTSTGTK